MIISDEEIAHVLSILKNRGPVQNSIFTAIIAKEFHHIPSGHFRQRMTNDDLVQYNKSDNTISLSKAGYGFINKYNKKIKRDDFNQWALFLKNLVWIIGFILSILLNIYLFLKVNNVF